MYIHITMCVIWIEGVCFELYSGYNDFWLHTIIKDNFLFLQEKRLINFMHVLNLCLLLNTVGQFFVSWSVLDPFYLLRVKCIVLFPFWLVFTLNSLLADSWFIFSLLPNIVDHRVLTSVSDHYAPQYSTQIYQPQTELMKQGRNLGERFYTNTACFLDLFAESPVGVLVHSNASKTSIVRPARVDTSLLWLFAYFALDIFTLHVLQGPQVKVALSLILEHLAVTILLLPIQEKGIGIVNYLVSKLR